MISEERKVKSKVWSEGRGENTSSACRVINGQGERVEWYGGENGPCFCWLMSDG
jgi:hypothetical protein